jgi:predicted DNA-binding transcriptional regulator AlpA
MPIMTNKISRRPVVLGLLGIKTATPYDHIKKGLIVKPINRDPRAVGWSADEIDKIIAARVVDKCEGDTKSLVITLTAARQQT